MRCTCVGKCLMNDSWLSKIIVKLLAGSRGHSTIVSNDRKRAEAAPKEEPFTSVTTVLEVVGRHPY